MKDFKLGDMVKHVPTGLIYQVDGCLTGIIYSDGEKDWCNVNYGVNPIHLTALPVVELKKLQ